jgi:predicted HTH domain antitoxin
LAEKPGQTLKKRLIGRFSPLRSGGDFLFYRPLTLLILSATLQAETMRFFRLSKLKGGFMPRRVNVELELPEEALATLRDEDLAAKAKEALVMELVREHHLSQGKAAEILKVSRSDFFSLMTKHQVPVIDLTPDELREELDKPFPIQ